MNKRIKKKQIKRALTNVMNGEATKKDIHIIKHSGRIDFVERVGCEPEEVPEAIENVRKVISTYVEAITQLLKPIIKAYSKLFKDIERAEAHETETTVQETQVQEQKSDD